MIPLLVLLGVFAVCRVAGWIGIEFFSEWQHCLRIALATMFLLTSSAHWGGKRADLIRMVPRELASPDLTVWLVALLIQSIQYAAALLVSLTSAFNIPAALLGPRPDELTKPVAQA